eukprot:TRINITY_DN11100_c0_g1_i1.p1 TRINITY_DN11100_c0_g1~~TRINITY_DN11100_c0_g1_i1.p1  ORF type:complete len:293 (+),score=37.42 TRINITY_DN11100_c0_g1_i1:64-879(+)
MTHQTTRQFRSAVIPSPPRPTPGSAQHPEPDTAAAAAVELAQLRERQAAQLQDILGHSTRLVVAPPTRSFHKPREAREARELAPIFAAPSQGNFDNFDSDTGSPASTVPIGEIPQRRNSALKPALRPSGLASAAITHTLTAEQLEHENSLAYSAVSEGNYQELEKQLSRTQELGIDLVRLSLSNHDEASLLHRAARHGDPEILSLLIRFCRTSHARHGVRQLDMLSTPDSRGFTPLHLAAHHGHIHVLGILLEERVAVNSSHFSSETYYLL